MGAPQFRQALSHMQAPRISSRSCPERIHLDSAPERDTCESQAIHSWLVVLKPCLEEGSMTDIRTCRWYRTASVSTWWR